MPAAALCVFVVVAAAGSATAQSTDPTDIQPATGRISYRLHPVELGAAELPSDSAERLALYEQVALDVATNIGTNVAPFVYFTRNGRPLRGGIAHRLENWPFLSGINPFASGRTCREFARTHVETPLEFVQAGAWGEEVVSLESFKSLFEPIIAAIIEHPGTRPKSAVPVYPLQIGPTFAYFLDTDELLLNTASAEVFASIGEVPSIDLPTQPSGWVIVEVYDPNGVATPEDLTQSFGEERVLAVTPRGVLLHAHTSSLDYFSQLGYLAEVRTTVEAETAFAPSETMDCIRGMPPANQRRAIATLMALDSGLPDVYHTYPSFLSTVGMIAAQAALANDRNALSGLPPLRVFTRRLGPASGPAGYHVQAIELSAGDGWELGKTVYIVGGTHARERLSHEIPLHFLSGLVNNYHSNEIAQDILTHRRIVFVPMLNPGGIDRAHFVDRLWRGNVRDLQCPVDLNRNFAEWPGGVTQGWTWEHQNLGLDCPEPSNISDVNVRYEPETRALMNEIHSATCGGPFTSPGVDCDGWQVNDGHGRSIDFLLNYHSFSQVLLYPFAFIDVEPIHTGEYTAMLGNLADQMLELSSVTYTTKQWNRLYAGTDGRASLRYGVLLDYAYAIVNIPSMMVELPPATFNEVAYGFRPPEHYIGDTYNHQLPVLLGAVMGKITGTVRDRNNNAAIGATVRVRNATTGDVREVTTTERGGFSFEHLTYALYTIEAFHDGWRAPVASRRVYPDAWGMHLSLTIEEGTSGGGGCSTSVVGRGAEGGTALVLVALVAGILVRRRSHHVS